MHNRNSSAGFTNMFIFISLGSIYLRKKEQQQTKETKFLKKNIWGHIKYDTI